MGGQGCSLLGPVVSPNSAIESEQHYQDTTPELAAATAKLVEYERRNETLPDGTTRSVDIQTSYGIPVVPKSTTFSGSDEFIKSKTGYANLNAPDGNTVEFTKEGTPDAETHANAAIAQQNIAGNPLWRHPGVAERTRAIGSVLS